ncbi:metallo-beta-lactamase family lipoprotein [Hyphomonas neptunium ATCC 15444]|uniref:Metallo-beta-lactamase family lipoprotein n=2 Tax=Hyphomonas TaxID=85 RepID=Q0BWU3_HYPNA|nr:MULTISPECIES: N-acyl homoserine lactonase family protein [Hyphomonas]ABI77455.1 metallo-beta-lactamase family lipoprotein [Hyphomonas neptunium ATCC 15444]KCZ91951.1 metallo-beta-lactamase family lipoprotein [Hyphomonas hirschiana VP5]
MRLRHTLKPLLLASSAAVILAACAPAAEDTPPPEAPAEEVAEASPAPAPVLTVDVLDCGTIGVSDLDAFSSAGDFAGQSDEFTNTCYLVNHPDGRLLWDLGLPSQLVGQPPFTQQIFTVSVEKSITEQLADLGVVPSELSYVSISHSHFDHIGQVDQVQGATWLVNQTEYDAMFPADGAPPADPSLTENYALFKPMETQIIEDRHDVFGDGSVVIFKTPGHTPGHASLQLTLPESGPVLLTGDLYHRTESRALSRVPRFNTSEEETLASMATFETRATDLEAKVVIQHEPDDVVPLGGIIR